MHDSPRKAGLSRRTFLRLSGLTGAALAVTPRGFLSAIRIGASEPIRWSDSRAWNGSLPGPADVVRITRPTIVDVDATVAGMVVESGGELVFDPNRSATVRTRGNVLVEGLLAMRPASSRIVHRLVFVNVDESLFVGGGHDPLNSDVGLWVMGSGRLDLRGSQKRAWTRAGKDVAAGARRIFLTQDPLGWRLKDEVVLTPTLAPTNSRFSTAFDRARIRGTSGRTIRLSAATRFAHPKVSVGRASGAEVLNLTRNVRIEGTPSGRSHILIHSSRAQTVKNVAIRHMGPRQPGDAEHPTVGVLGRYGLHFHECGSSSRGSVVSGVVARDCGNHCFVAHNSHGVTFRDCISYDTWDEPYWWDLPTSTYPEPPDTFSNDIVYDHCVAAVVRYDPDFRAGRLSGFQLGTSTVDKSCRALNCVAVGVQGIDAASPAGFNWPEVQPGYDGVWVMEDCVAHNNARDGIFTWQNTGTVHVIDRFTAYHNGKAGIEHGAYVNPYVYRDSLLYGNGEAGVINSARSPNNEDGPMPPMRYERITVDGAGITPVGFLERDINAPDNPPVVVCAPTIRNVSARFDDSPVSSQTFDVRETC